MRARVRECALQGCMCKCGVRECVCVRAFTCLCTCPRTHALHVLTLCTALELVGLSGKVKIICYFSYLILLGGGLVPKWLGQNSSRRVNEIASSCRGFLRGTEKLPATRGLSTEEGEARPKKEEGCEKSKHTLGNALPKWRCEAKRIHYG